MINKLNETISFLNKRGINVVDVGIVLGTGLGKLIDSIKIIDQIDYSQIPHFPISTVESHNGKLIYGELGGKKVLTMQGRFHYYEGYSLAEVTYPVRVMKLIGAKYLLLSNACGSMNPNFKKGELMLIDDHLNFIPDNPLRGINNSELGPRFPDMSSPYSKYLNDTLQELASEMSIKLHKGIYVAVMGPNLETRAEYRMFSKFADVVGMSTVPEIIVANHMGLPACAISVITDECDPDNLKAVSLAEILEVASKAEKGLTKLFEELVSRIK